VFPGVNEVIVPPPSVVVVVVVSETCAHANGAAIAKATLNSIFFIDFSFLFFVLNVGKLFDFRGVEQKASASKSISHTPTRVDVNLMGIAAVVRFDETRSEIQLDTNS
jgi:hypothetical protein